jgi:hypothetical protein
MPFTPAGLSSRPSPERPYSSHDNAHATCASRSQRTDALEPSLAHTNDVRRTVGALVTSGGSLCATTPTTHDGGFQQCSRHTTRGSYRSRRPASAWLTVHLAANVSSSVDAPSSWTAMENDDHTWVRRATGYEATSAFHPFPLPVRPRRGPRRQVPSASAVLVEMPCRALLIDSHELATTSRRAPREHRNVEVPSGVTA